MTAPSKLLDTLASLTGPQERGLDGCASEAFAAFRRGDHDKVEAIVDAYGLEAVYAGIPPAELDGPPVDAPVVVGDEDERTGPPAESARTRRAARTETADGTPGDAETATEPKPASSKTKPTRSRSRSTKAKR